MASWKDGALRFRFREGAGESVAWASDEAGGATVDWERDLIEHRFNPMAGAEGPIGDDKAASFWLTEKALQASRVIDFVCFEAIDELWETSGDERVRIITDNAKWRLHETISAYNLPNLTCVLKEKRRICSPSLA